MTFIYLFVKGFDHQHRLFFVFLSPSRSKAGPLRRIEHPGFLLVFGLVFHLAGFPIAGHPFRKRFSYASKRVIEILEALAGKTDIRNLDHWKKRVEERSGHMPKGQRWFLLNKLLGLRPSEIAEMEGLDRKSSSGSRIQGAFWSIYRLLSQSDWPQT